MVLIKNPDSPAAEPFIINTLPGPGAELFQVAFSPVIMKKLGGSDNDFNFGAQVNATTVGDNIAIEYVGKVYLPNGKVGDIALK